MPIWTPSLAVAHERRGVGKSTSAVLLAAEIGWLRPDWTILVEDHDPARHLTARWPGDEDWLRLVPPGTGRGDLRILDTGPGDADQLAPVLRRADYVVVPVRMEATTLQALRLFLPRLSHLQHANGGTPRLAGFAITHYVGESAEHVEARRAVEELVRQHGSEVLGVVPVAAAIETRLSTKGHHYRPAAQRLLQMLDADRATQRRSA